MISPDDWLPVDVDSLEPAAERAVRSETNTLVVAGPGAGKSELLAQRANFLLLTGHCPRPQRVLALSFKRDAAGNLRERVARRCGEHAHRFDSMTIDSFAKGLVDRFRLGLPVEWRPRESYEPLLTSIKWGQAENWMNSVPLPGGLERPAVIGWGRAKIEASFARVTHGESLPYSSQSGVLNAMGTAWWREQLGQPSDQPSLTFPMLCRLAAFLLRLNPRILRALRHTYSHVFLDEFQDTTSPQWELVATAFEGATSVVTAVGDDKQSIMRWAGAMVGCFDAFSTTFGGERVQLLRKYRSAPALVRIQHSIAQLLDPDVVAPASASASSTGGQCVLWKFPDSAREAQHLAHYIADQVDAGQAASDFCILVRSQTSKRIREVQECAAQAGVVIRDEQLLQDLRSEPFARLALEVLRAASGGRSPDGWVALNEMVADLLGDDEAAVEGLSTELCEAARVSVANDDLESLPGEVLARCSREAFTNAYAQYLRGSYLHDVVGRLRDALVDSFARVQDGASVYDDLAGVGVVPAMTIHKSKGLEFHTVIFLGLEDAQWWGARKELDEETRAFFVAFSRATERVIFTHCSSRDGAPQTTKDVSPFHEVLSKAGVETHEFM